MYNEVVMTKQELLDQVQYCKEKIDKLPSYLLPPQNCCHNMDKYQGTIKNFTYCPFCGRKIKGEQEYE